MQEKMLQLPHGDQEEKEGSLQLEVYGQKDVLPSLDSFLVLAIVESLESDWLIASVDRLSFIQVTSWDY